jgi:hypothetical protein
MFTHAKPTAAVPVVAKKVHPTEIRGDAAHGYGYVATASGYQLFRDGVEVGIGVGQACVETNAQRARQALANRGIIPV